MRPGLIIYIYIYIWTQRHRFFLNTQFNWKSSSLSDWMSSSLSVSDPQSLWISILASCLNSLSQKLIKRKHMAMISVQNLVKERKYPFIFAFAILLVSASIFLYSNNFQSLTFFLGDLQKSNPTISKPSQKIQIQGVWCLFLMGIKCQFSGRKAGTWWDYFD